MTIYISTRKQMFIDYAYMYIYIHIPRNVLVLTCNGFFQSKIYLRFRLKYPVVRLIKHVTMKMCLLTVNLSRHLLSVTLIYTG